MESDSEKDGRNGPAEPNIIVPLRKYITRDKQCCRNCTYSQRLRGPNTNPRTGTCHFNPPVIMQVMMPNMAAMLQPGQPSMQPGLQGAWPPVDLQEGWCGKWCMATEGEA